MSFFVFKLLFAALAVGLLIVFGLIARNLWRTRAHRTPPLAREAQAPAPAPAPKPRKPRLGRKAVEPPPAPEAPPRVRRRQLQSFAEAERRETEGAAEPAQPAEEPEPTPAAQPSIATPPQPPGMPEAAAPAPEEAYDQAVLARLEDAFDALQAGAITLATYRTRVIAEEAAVEQHIAALEAADAPAPEALEAALTARASVRWCLDWAAEQDNPREI